MRENKRQLERVEARGGFKFDYALKKNGSLPKKGTEKFMGKCEELLHRGHPYGFPCMVLSKEGVESVGRTCVETKRECAYFHGGRKLYM